MLSCRQTLGCGFFDTVYYVVLDIPSTYRSKVGGLCGNFNGYQNDDFQLPNKQVAKNVNEFGFSWKINVAGAKCSDGCNAGECPVCKEAKLQPFQATSSCGMITNPSGPFRSCHGKISPVEYFDHCIYDSCAVDGKDEVLCKSLQAYATACHTVRATIGSWRTPTFCSLSCPSNSHYELCTRTCEQTCSGLSAPTKCTDQCFEGCECDPGYVLDGDECVPMGQCGCVFSGRYMSEGDSFIKADCTRQCKCQAGFVTCTVIRCGDKERCGVLNGVRGCYKIEGECSVKSQKLVTFDGLTGGPLGNGPVEVASLCSDKADGWFRVIADVQSCGNVETSVARVHIFFDGSPVTISKDKEVWINGRLGQLLLEAGILTADVGENSVFIRLGVDMRIELKESGTLVLRVSEKLAGTVCGACGNFNGVVLDDLKTPGGKAATDFLQFIACWRARDLTSCKE